MQRLKGFKKNSHKYITNSSDKRKTKEDFHSFSRLTLALFEKGETKLAKMVRSYRYDFTEDGDLIKYMASVLEDHPLNLKGPYSLFIDESSIKDDSCIFYVSDEEGEEQAKLKAYFNVGRKGNAINLRWEKFKAIAFIRNSFESSLAKFLKNTDLDYEVDLDLEDDSKDAIKKYINRLLKNISKSLE